MRHFFRVCLASVTLAAAAWAQSAPLTLADCVRLALDARGKLSLAQNDLRIAQQGVVAARTGFLPQVQASGGYTYNTPARTAGSPQPQQFIALNAVHEYVTQFGASIALDTSGKLRAELARARAEREAARLTLKVTERDLRREVTAAYYRLVLARRLVEVAKSTLAEAQGFESRARKLNAGGEAARADVVKAQAEAAFLQQALQGAELDAETANHDLASYWTADVGAPLNVVDALDAPLPQPENAILSDAYMRRPEFQVFDAQRLGLRADVSRARADLLPQASLNWEYGIDAARYSFAYRGQALFATVNVPLFDWFKTRSAMRQSEARLASFDISREMARRDLSRDYQTAIARARSNWSQIETAREQVRLSEENYRLAKLRYEGGEGLALDVVSAQTQVAQARGNYFSAISAYLNARADFEVASGQ